MKSIEIAEQAVSLIRLSSKPLSLHELQLVLFYHDLTAKEHELLLRLAQKGRILLQGEGYGWSRFSEEDLIERIAEHNIFYRLSTDGEKRFYVTEPEVALEKG